MWIVGEYFKGILTNNRLYILKVDGKNKHSAIFSAFSRQKPKKTSKLFPVDMSISHLIPTERNKPGLVWLLSNCITSQYGGSVQFLLSWRPILSHLNPRQNCFVLSSLDVTVHGLIFDLFYDGWMRTQICVLSENLTKLITVSKPRNF